MPDITSDMLKLCRVTKVKVLFLALVYVFNFNLLVFEFSAAIIWRRVYSISFIRLLLHCLVHDVVSVIPGFFVIIIIDILDRDKTFYSMDIRG